MRTQEVAALITRFDPDIFGIIEFGAKYPIRDLIMNHFSKYDFVMIDSTMGIEIQVGWERGAFRRILFTQRRKFQEGNMKS
ncbi:Uncharacterised protein [Halioglobus japonicus]|nr:Uncharacterised protein [Halioglobus japonicus]